MRATRSRDATKCTSRALDGAHEQKHVARRTRVVARPELHRLARIVRRLERALKWTRRVIDVDTRSDHR
jgi:hypothetical protein